MCGIIGYIGKDNAVDIVMDGLKHLEYRGYDSAGIAYFNGSEIEIKRCKGKIKDLEKCILNETSTSTIAIGHTRWATHGIPSINNAHPHKSEKVVLVHNGIIENYLELKEELTEKGYNFLSETDTEVIVHLIDYYHKNMEFEDAVRKALKKLKGAYALVILSVLSPDSIIGVRKDSPLVFGIGEDGYYLASDVPAFLKRTKKVIFLNDEEMVIVKKHGYRISNLLGESIKKQIHTINWNAAMADKGGYKHFMLKEIYEQPRAIADTIRGRILYDTYEINIKEFMLDKKFLKTLKRIFIVACGTSWHAGLVGKYMIEQIAKVPVEVDLASEFRYRNPLIKKDDLCIVITQSGETADTLAAQRQAKSLGAKVLSICNVLGATSAREADAVFYTHSGPEIGVASTKAFTSQLVSLYMFSILLANEKEILEKEKRILLIQYLLKLPDKIESILKEASKIEEIAKLYSNVKDFLYLGRGILYPIALEGALKLKEISYIHAEGYPAGEMKHGPIALVDEKMPVVFLIQKGELEEKIISNIQEVKAREGKVIVVKTSAVKHNFNKNVDHIIEIPESNKYLESILIVVPLQLIAYYIGVKRGCDVDQPRNLAKSVTVE